MMAFGIVAGLLALFVVASIVGGFLSDEGDA